MTNFRYEYPNPHLPRVKQPPADYVDPHRTIYAGNSFDDTDSEPAILIGLGLAAISGCIVGLAIGWGVWG